MFPSHGKLYRMHVMAFKMLMNTAFEIPHYRLWWLGLPGVSNIWQAMEIMAVYKQSSLML